MMISNPKRAGCLQCLLIMLFFSCLVAYNLTWGQVQYNRYLTMSLKSLFYIQKIEGSVLLLLFFSMITSAINPYSSAIFSITCLCYIINFFLTPVETVLFIKARGHGLHFSDKLNLWCQQIVGYILFLILFIFMFVGICMALGRRRERRQAEEQIELEQKDLNQRRAQILKKYEKIPTVKDLPADLTSCPVCLNQPEPNLLYKQLSCGHIVHGKCALDWFDIAANHNKLMSCPVCRKVLE